MSLTVLSEESIIIKCFTLIAKSRYFEVSYPYRLTLVGLAGGGGATDDEGYWLGANDSELILACPLPFRS